jgi:hypothetical protein
MHALKPTPEWEQPSQHAVAGLRHIVRSALLHRTSTDLSAPNRISAYQVGTRTPRSKSTAPHPGRPSKPVRPCNPRLGRFDSCAAPLSQNQRIPRDFCRAGRARRTARSPVQTRSDTPPRERFDLAPISQSSPAAQSSRRSVPSHVIVAPLATAPTQVGQVPQQAGAASAQRSRNGITRKSQSRNARSTVTQCTSAPGDGE